MEQKIFIYTTSKESAEELTKKGFVLIKQEGEQWTFLNDRRKTFGKLDRTIYTNKIDFD